MTTTRRIKAGTTDVSVIIRIIDSADGTPETGVVFNTAGIDLEYRREGAASADITEATLSALTDAHTDGGFLAIGNGYYRLDLPDAACAAGATGVLVHGTVTGMVVIGTYIELVAYDPYDTVRLGLTALPNAVAETAGGLYTRGTGAGQINQAANGMIDTNPVRLNNVSQSLLDLKDLADDGYDPATNKVQGVVLVDTLTTYTGDTPQTGDSFARIGATGSGLTSLATQASVNTLDDFVDTEIGAIITTLGTPAGASVSADIAAIEAQTDDIGAAGAGLTAIPWNTAWDAEVQSEVDDALVAQNLDHLIKSAVDTDFPTTVHLNSVVGHLADNGTSATFDRTTDSLEALEGKVDAVDNFVDTEVPAILAAVDTEISAIKAVTDLIPNGGAMSNLDVAISTRATPAQVNTEVLDVLNVDTFAEVGQESPAATQTIRRMLAFLYKAWRNRSTQTSTQYKLYGDDAVTVDHKATVSDDNTTFDKGEVSTGP